MNRGPDPDPEEAANDAAYHPADANGMTWEEAREYILPPAPNARVLPFRPKAPDSES